MAGLCIASTSHATEFLSTYSETLACPVTEEGEDAFIRECTGPGNVRAVLQYVEGLVGVFYLPMGGKTPLEREDMFEISPKARQPYGGKLEWRQRFGDATPCAAVIRVFTNKGEVLVVNELATGNRIGVVKANQQARVLADRTCGEAKAMPTIAEAESTQVVKPVMLPAEDGSVSEAARLGRERFMQIYTETGIVGAIEAIEHCYSDFQKQPSATKLAECGAIDLTGAEADGSVLSGRPDLQQAFLAKDKPAARLTAGMKTLGLDDEARQTFTQEFETATGMRVAAQAPAKPQSGSVFNFSE
jgi:hypothetical protein